MSPGTDRPQFDPDAPAIEDELAAIWADVPASAWAKLPADLSDNLDHYLYGTPKKRGVSVPGRIFRRLALAFRPRRVVRAGDSAPHISDAQGAGKNGTTGDPRRRARFSGPHSQIGHQVSPHHYSDVVRPEDAWASLYILGGLVLAVIATVAIWTWELLSEAKL